MSRWITGPGGEHDEHGVVVDMSEAVLLDGWTTCAVHLGEQGNALALAMMGKLNKQTDRSDVLYVADAEGAAALVAEIIGVFARNGQGVDFLARVGQAMHRVTGGQHRKPA